MQKEEYAKALSVLHKYWIWSNMMKVKFVEQLTQTQKMENMQNFHLSEIGVYMMYWYSSLYAVVEGYKDFKMKNLEIDNLLNEHENLELLRRFRNGAFHVQKEYFSEKYLDFIAAKNSAEWVSNLSETIGSHLIDELRKLQSK